jgi:hypothetical protein
MPLSEVVGDSVFGDKTRFSLNPLGFLVPYGGHVKAPNKGFVIKKSLFKNPKCLLINHLSEVVGDSVFRVQCLRIFLEASHRALLRNLVVPSPSL